MKKTRKAIAALLLAASLSLPTLSAQEAGRAANDEFTGHWFIGVKGGIGHTVGETSFGRLISPAASIDFGYQFTPVWGLRAGLSGWQAKGAAIGTSTHVYKYNYLQGSVDVLVDLCGIAGYNRSRAVNPYIFAGVGVNGAFNNDEAQALSPKLPEDNYLWDGSREVKLVATGGRTARVGDTKNGSFAEMIAYDVPYQEDTVDISIRIDMDRKTRNATITATELSGKPVMFLTGVNYHPGETVKCGDGFIYAWGVHPADVSSSPVPIGAGLFYKPSDFGPMEVTPDMVRIISKPKSSVTTTVVAASTKEAELNTVKRFENYMLR